MKLVRFSLRRPVTLGMLVTSVIVLGAISVRQLPLAFLPQVEFPFIGVLVPMPGSLPSEVERDVARPIEEVLATLGGIREIFSESDENQTFVGVEFDWGRDVNVMRLEVQEKIDQIRGTLPPQVRDVYLFTFNSNDIPILEGRISAKGRDLSESYDLIESRIIRPLQRIPGVGRVGIDGVNATEGAIYLRFDRIKEHSVDVGRLFEELATANVDLSIGRVTENGLRYDVRSVSGLSRIEELQRAAHRLGDLRLGDVAELVYAAPVTSYGRRLNGEFAIALEVQKASGYNTVEVARAVEGELEKINLDPALSGINSFVFFNQGDQIEDSLKGLWESRHDRFGAGHRRPVRVPATLELDVRGRPGDPALAAGHVRLLLPHRHDAERAHHDGAHARRGHARRRRRGGAGSDRAAARARRFPDGRVLPRNQRRRAGDHRLHADHGDRVPARHRDSRRRARGVARAGRHHHRDHQAGLTGNESHRRSRARGVPGAAHHARSRGALAPVAALALSARAGMDDVPPPAAHRISSSCPLRSR